LPSEEERTQIFRIHLAKRSRPPEGFRLPEMVAASKDFSGAEIEQAVISALYDAFYARTDLTTEHIVEALRQTVPLSKTMDEQLSRLRTWAEGRARHASLARPAAHGTEHRRMEF